MKESFNSVIDKNNKDRDQKIVIVKEKYISKYEENTTKIKACKDDNFKYSYIEIEKR